MSTKAERKAAAALLGSATSPAKAAAARENGKAGGAPRLCECGHKRGAHTLTPSGWSWCTGNGSCACLIYKARED